MLTIVATTDFKDYVAKQGMQRASAPAGTNLLDETLEALTEHGKAPSDVRWVGDAEHRTSWADFAEVAERTAYDNGYGIEEIDMRLKVVGDDWWLERQEYDGSEEWEYKASPPPPPAARLVSVCRRDTPTNYYGWRGTTWQSLP